LFLCKCLRNSSIRKLPIMPFKNIRLNDGNKIPAIAFGTGTALFRRDATDSVIQALEIGFSHIDTAQSYGNEDSVGAAIRESKLPRADLFVTTKYLSGPIRRSFEEGLGKLGLSFVDLYLIHIPERVKITDWEEFEKIKRDGLARSIGVSNYNLEQLRALVEYAKIKPAVNQVEFHPYNYKDQKTLVEYAAQHEIVIEAYGVLSPITQFPGGPVDAPIAAAAKCRGVTPAQIILAWVRAKGAVIVTTSSKKQHLQEYLASSDIPPLTEDEIAAIDAAGAGGPPS